MTSAPDTEQHGVTGHPPASRPGLAGRPGQTAAGILTSRAARTTLAATANLVASLVIGALFAAAIAVALVVSLATSWIVGLGVLVRASALQMSARMGQVDRQRIERTSGARIEPLPQPQPDPGTSRRERWAAWAGARWLWRLPAYQLVRLPLAGAMAFVAVGWWWATIDCFILATGPDARLLLLAWPVGPLNPDAGGILGLVVAGVVGILAWPVLSRGVLHLDRLVAEALLGPSRSGQLASEVAHLSEARALAVESAEAERRRIERDLHDGLQPQLVSLALDLGLARTRIERDPQAAREMVERAHEEAKRATTDLRNLVRGIHPSVLDERGLDAALSALVASCPVPVAVEVALPERVDATREAVAYFVVAEAITNITKHARAHHASVVVGTEGNLLRVAVEDDGAGGARLEPGGGLSGLSARVASVDGHLSLSSPPGGPTRIEAVIPCAP